MLQILMHAFTQVLENYEQKSTASLCEILTIHTNIYVKNINLVLIQILFLLCFLCVCSLFNACFYASKPKNSTNSLKFFRCSSNYLSTQTFSLFPEFSCPLSALSCQLKKKKQTETKTHTLTFTPPIILFTGSVLSCSFLKYLGVMRCPSLYAVIFFKTVII